MADITLSWDRNWSDVDGLGNPGSHFDRIYLNDYDLTLDVGLGAGNNSFTCLAIVAKTGGGATCTGRVILARATTVINADLQAGHETLLSVGSGEAVDVHGTVTGGSGAAGRHGISVASGGTLYATTVIGGATAGSYGVYVNGGTVIICTASGAGTAVGCYVASGEATVSGADGDTADAVYVAGGTVEVTAYAKGTTTGEGVHANGGTLTVAEALGESGGYGVRLSGAATATITSTTGGYGDGAHGVYVYGPSCICTVGTAKGGTHARAKGVVLVLGTLTVNGTDLSGVGHPVGLAGTLKIGGGVRLEFQDASGDPKIFYGPDAQPAEADVRDGTDYGYGDYTGSMATGGSVPAPVIGRNIMRRA